MAFLSNIQHLFNGVDIDDLMKEVSSLKRELDSAKKKIASFPMLVNCTKEKSNIIKGINAKIT